VVLSGPAVPSRQRAAYCHVRVHLPAAARPFWRTVRRRAVPPGMVTLEPQTGRATPGLERGGVPGPVPGVAHVLAAGVAATYAAISQDCVVPIAWPRRTRVSRPAITRPSMELCSAPSRPRRCAPTARVHVRGFGP